MMFDWAKVCLFSTVGLAVAIVLVILIASVDSGAVNSGGRVEVIHNDASPSPEPISPVLSKPDSIVSPADNEIVRSIHTVDRDSESRDYELTDKVYFSDPNAHVLYNFWMPKSRELLTSVNKWYPKAEVYYEESGRRVEVEFERSDNNLEGSGQIRILLKNAPKRDLLLVLTAEEGRETISQIIYYTEPFQYTMDSDNPIYTMMKQAHEMDATFWQSWWVRSGEEVQLELAFTKDVDADSLSEKMKTVFGDEHEWTLDWQSERVVRLKLKMIAGVAPYPVWLDLTGIVDTAGYTLVDRLPLEIYNHAGFAFGTLDADTMQTKELFRTTQQFYSFLPNDEGTLALAQVSESNEAGVSLYIMLDLTQGGKIVHIFQPRELSYPQWVRASNSFLNSSQRDGANTIDRYDVPTGQSTNIWTSPHNDNNHEGARWARAYTVPGEEKWYITDYRTTAEGYSLPHTVDLYEWVNIDDENPRLTKDFREGRCEGSSCYPMFNAVSSDGIFYVKQIADAKEAPFHEYLMYGTIDGSLADVRMEEEDGNRVESFIAVDEKRVVVVRESLVQEQWKYVFYIHYPWEHRQEYLMETNAWSGYSHHAQAIPLGNNRFIVGTGAKGTILDLSKRTITRLDYEPVGQAGELIYWTKRLD